MIGKVVIAAVSLIIAVTMVGLSVFTVSAVYDVMGCEGRMRGTTIFLFVSLVLVIAKVFYDCFVGN